MQKIPRKTRNEAPAIFFFTKKMFGFQCGGLKSTGRVSPHDTMLGY